MIAYIRKGHIQVEVIKNMGSNFYKCRVIKRNNTRRKDVHLLDLETKQRKPLTNVDLAHLPKLWKDE